MASASQLPTQLVVISIRRAHVIVGPPSVTVSSIISAFKSRLLSSHMHFPLPSQSEAEPFVETHVSVDSSQQNVPVPRKPLLHWQTPSLVHSVFVSHRNAPHAHLEPPSETSNLVHGSAPHRSPHMSPQEPPRSPKKKLRISAHKKKTRLVSYSSSYTCWQISLIKTPKKRFPVASPPPSASGASARPRNNYSSREVGGNQKIA